MLRTTVLFLSCLLCAAVWAETLRVRAVALFADKALLVIDDRKRLVAVGETTPEGVTLIAADSGQATVEIAGERRVFGLDDSVGGRYAGPEVRAVRIPRGRGGMFTTAGGINGRPVEFLVDTGASVVAMSAAEARRLGIDFRRDGTRMAVATAAGVATAYRVMLDRVTVGEIHLTNVEAAVLEGDSPPVPLLGMSFLGRVDMRRETGLMVLEQKR